MQFARGRECLAVSDTSISRSKNIAGEGIENRREYIGSCRMWFKHLALSDSKTRENSRNNQVLGCDQAEWRLYQPHKLGVGMVGDGFSFCQKV